MYDRWIWFCFGYLTIFDRSVGWSTEEAVVWQQSLVLRWLFSSPRALNGFLVYVRHTNRRRLYDERSSQHNTAARRTTTHTEQDNHAYSEIRLAPQNSLYEIWRPLSLEITVTVSLFNRTSHNHTLWGAYLTIRAYYIISTRHLFNVYMPAWPGDPVYWIGGSTIWPHIARSTGEEKAHQEQLLWRLE